MFLVDSCLSWFWTMTIQETWNTSTLNPPKSGWSRHIYTYFQPVKTWFLVKSLFFALRRPPRVAWLGPMRRRWTMRARRRLRRLRSRLQETGVKPKPMGGYPLVMTNSSLLKMAILSGKIMEHPLFLSISIENDVEIVSFPMKHGDFP